MHGPALSGLLGLPTGRGPLADRHRIWAAHWSRGSTALQRQLGKAPAIGRVSPRAGNTRIPGGFSGGSEMGDCLARTGCCNCSRLEQGGDRSSIEGRASCRWFVGCRGSDTLVRLEGKAVVFLRPISLMRVTLSLDLSPSQPQSALGAYMRSAFEILKKKISVTTALPSAALILTIISSR